MDLENIKQKIQKLQNIKNSIIDKEAPIKAELEKVNEQKMKLELDLIAYAEEKTRLDNQIKECNIAISVIENLEQ